MQCLDALCSVVLKPTVECCPPLGVVSVMLSRAKSRVTVVCFQVPAYRCGAKSWRTTPTVVPTVLSCLCIVLSIPASTVGMTRVVRKRLRLRPHAEVPLLPVPSLETAYLSWFPFLANVGQNATYHRVSGMFRLKSRSVSG